jgi:hypothetical protein
MVKRKAEAKRSKPRTHKRDAFPDRVDVRDWLYQPTLAPLPDALIGPQLAANMVLDQGNEGACTGFALAAVINYHLAQRKLERRVSPRMLYEMARRYDEWPGERYEGSSARGAIKGWVAHGVCVEALWPNDRASGVLSERIAQEAQATPGGAYYRVVHKNIRDMHAALSEVGMVYCTLMVHSGWDEPGPQKISVAFEHEGQAHTLRLPVITRKGAAEDGHAVAIVGYTADGFIIQNSWGHNWGRNGFALLPYEDFLQHATDVWVVQLGVPVHMGQWSPEAPRRTLVSSQRAARAIPLADIRPYVVDLGKGGELSSGGTYWTTREDVQRLFSEVIPKRTEGWSRRRVLLYVHGGLNGEAAVAKRVMAFRDVMLANEIYPVHVMWESGFWETLLDMLREHWQERPGAAAWVNTLRDGASEAKDRTLELTFARPGGALWREMKQNARLASSRDDQRGGMQILAKCAKDALTQLPPEFSKRFELHIAAHSAGSIFAAHALPELMQLGAALKSVQFMAPALSIERFKQLMLQPILAGACPLPTLYMLSDERERAEQLGPYGKSLLYLVSRAFEARRDEPLLGMARNLVEDDQGSTAQVDRELAKLFGQATGGRQALVIAGEGGAAGSCSDSHTHAGFDNDVSTLNSLLRRVLRSAPKLAFTERDLAYDGERGPREEATRSPLSAAQNAALGKKVPANTQTAALRRAR